MRPDPPGRRRGFPNFGNRLRALLLAAAAAVFLLSPFAARAAEAAASVPRGQVEAAIAKAGRPPAPARSLRIVLLSDRKDHGPGAHDYPLWQEQWAPLLRAGAAGAAAVTVECATNWPSETQFASADAVVAFCYLPWTDERKAQVRGYLARGGGLVLIHSATWTKPKPDAAVAELTGVGGFTRYRHGPIDLDIAAGHPVCAGLPPRVALADETYWPPTPPPAAGRIAVLATALERDATDAEPAAQPMFWTFEAGRGRVFGCVPGHFTSTFGNPWFRLLLLRGIAWSAREDPRRFDGLVFEGEGAK